MALIDSVLASALKSIFMQMQNGSKDDNWMADQMAKAIDDQIKTAGIASGSVIISVSGQAVGIPNTNPITVQ